MKLYLILLCLCFSAAAMAQDKDQVLVFETYIVDGKTCIENIVVDGDDNCKIAGGGRGSCEGIKDCVCSKPEKHIEWDSSTIANYTVYFYQASPFKENCKLDSNNQGKLKCQIKGDANGNYDYGVRVPGCTDFDPRIIIN
jgi:hypothetical protein